MKIKNIFFLLLSIAPIHSHILATVEINDISNLNATQVTRIEYPKTIQELISVVNQAKKDGLKISMAGKKHSQGGQTFYKNTVVIDINSLTAITHLDVQNKVVTVQPGVTWKDIQHFCNPHGLALKVTQTANIFTVGGSLSVNCHGRDPHYGPLIETIKAFRILLADGSLVNASRSENQELFSLVIGGYGLFGIITEVDIWLTENDVYKKSIKILNPNTYSSFVKENIIDNPNVGLHYGQLSPDFSKIIAINYTKTKNFSSKAFKLSKERWIGITKFLLILRRKLPGFNKMCKVTDWSAIVAREALPQTTCRNNAMTHPVECLVNKSKDDTDLLQSYFIPIDTLPDFIKRFKKLINKENINTFYVLIRYIAKDTQSFLRYAKDNYFEIVIFANIKRTKAQVAHTKKWTRKLIDIVLDLNGCYYLPTQLYATDAQLERAYPMINQFFAKKLAYDPQELFINSFYKRYAV